MNNCVRSWKEKHNDDATWPCVLIVNFVHVQLINILFFKFWTDDSQPEVLFFFLACNCNWPKYGYIGAFG